MYYGMNCEYSCYGINSGQYSSLFDKQSYLIGTMGIQGYIAKLWQSEWWCRSIPCNRGDPSWVESTFIFCIFISIFLNCNNDLPPHEIGLIPL